MDTKTNIFFHAPKELTTDAFLVWLLYFLDSNEVWLMKLLPKISSRMIDVFETID